MDYVILHSNNTNARFSSTKITRTYYWNKII